MDQPAPSSSAAPARSASPDTARLVSLGQLVAEILQDLSGPMTSARDSLEACVRLIDAQPSSPPELSRAALRALSNVGRATDLMRRVRSFAHLDVSRAPNVWINEVVRAAVGQCSAELRMRNVGLRLELTEALPPIELDPEHIQQALVNLIFNALEAMAKTPPDQRELTIRTAPGGAAMLEIVVRDCGCGLPAELGDRIFEPYVTTRPNRLGLGLYVSRKIVAAHGGRLWGRSVPPAGSEFRMELPIGSPSSSPANTDRSSRGP